jgi:hypothetical protein
VRRIAPLALACPLLVLAACGNARTPAASVIWPAAPTGFRALSYPQSGLAFDAPRNWAASAQQAPLVATVSSGAAIVAVWRYTGHRRGSSSPAELQQALIRRARLRDPTLRVIASHRRTIDRAPAIVLDAVESIAGSPRRVRSIHIFTRGAEIVVDEYAPPFVFDAVNSKVFARLARSVRLTGASAA